MSALVLRFLVPYRQLPLQYHDEIAFLVVDSLESVSHMVLHGIVRLIDSWQMRHDVGEI